MIAIALACNPKLIADEPTTALDVTIQAQVLELMKQLIQEREMSMLLITHDLGVVAEVCDDGRGLRGADCGKREPRTTCLTTCTTLIRRGCLTPCPT